MRLVHFQLLAQHSTLARPTSTRSTGQHRPHRRWVGILLSRDRRRTIFACVDFKVCGMRLTFVRESLTVLVDAV